MKLQIAGRDYDYLAALNKASLGTLYDLKIQGGIGKRAVVDAMDLLSKGLTAEEGETAKAASARSEKMQEDARVTQGLTGLIFVCKRHAGEKVTWVDAASFAWGDLLFVAEEADTATDDDELPEPRKLKTAG